VEHWKEIGIVSVLKLSPTQRKLQTCEKACTAGQMPASLSQKEPHLFGTQNSDESVGLAWKSSDGLSNVVFPTPGKTSE
jgi:hypothetical protein